jgi:alkylation response protein AidB-like acyl-CoA dehydrogenase
MYLTINESQKMLKKTARDFLMRESLSSLLRQLIADEKGYSKEVWSKMVDLGWTSMVFPEQYGGIGSSYFDLVILLEEMGRVLLPSPFFTTIVSCGLPIWKTGNETQRQTYLPKIISGEKIFTLAIAEPAGLFGADGIETTIHDDKDYYIVNGTKLLVPYAHVADNILCICIEDKKKSPSLFYSLLIDTKSQGISCNSLDTPGIDRQYELVLNDVKVPKKNLLGEAPMNWPQIEEILSWSVIGKCAEMVGGADMVLEFTVDYAKQRVQFGKPIGSFQAIQHHMANMKADVVLSKTLTYYAASKLSQGLSCRKEVAAAKAHVSISYRRVTALAHQIHAGVAFMTDHDLHLYFEQAKAAEVAYGDADYYINEVAMELGL